MLRRDFQMLAIRRAAEADNLYRAELFDGAYYLAGLAIECAFKACIARQTRRFEFPDRRRSADAFTHNLTELRRSAGLDQQMENSPAPLRAKWSTVKDWKIEARYRHGMQSIDCRDFIDAAIARNGVLPWVKRYW